MQQHDIIEAMRSLGLKGMADAFDDAVTTGLQRQRATMEILTDLLRAEATAHSPSSYLASISSCSMNWAICCSLDQAASCCSS